jgi:peptidyl-prolyl cis-trans isomerase C
MINNRESQKKSRKKDYIDKGVVNRIIRKPLVHFLLLGTVLYLLYGFISDKIVEAIDIERTITVTNGEIAMMEDSWQKQWNRPPTEEEREGLINAYIKEMVFYRVALEMGLDKNDVRVRRLLGQKLQFITNDLIKPEPPVDNELERYLKDNSERFTSPQRVTMTQIFFDPDKRENQTLVDAENAILILNKIDIGSVNASEYGDRMMMQNYYPRKTESEIAKYFGSEFAKSVFELETNKWQGPILSGYGTHVVYLHDRQIPDTPNLNDIMEQVTWEWMNEKQQELNELYYKGLVDRFEIVIEKPETGGTIEKKE